MLCKHLIGSIALELYRRTRTMTAKELIDNIKSEFFGRLDRKTGWGKKEVKMEFEGAVIDAISKTIHLSEHPDLGFDDDLPF